MASTGSRGGMRVLAATIPRVTRRALGRRGFAEAGLVTEWPNIVGDEIAAVCIPRKLSHPRPGHRDSGTLTVRVDAGAALEIQHLEPVLVERINSYFGYRAVARLRLLQAPVSAPDTRRRPPEPKPRGEASDDSALDSRIESVEDSDLRAALARLGWAVRDRRD
ncbi:MAG: DUF721 domain-containing protein [Kiloniellaceae bacterium]